MYYTDQTSKVGKWYIILSDKCLYLLFKHHKAAVVTHMIHEIIIDFLPQCISLLLTSDWNEPMEVGIVFFVWYHLHEMHHSS